MKASASSVLLFSVLFVAVLAISSASILIKLCAAPAMVIASYRLTFASLFFLTGATVRRTSPLRGLAGKERLLALTAGAFLCLHFATWITSLKFTSVASSVVLVSTAPIFVALGSAVFLRETISRVLAIGIAITVLGAIVLSAKDFEFGKNVLLGDALALTGAVGSAGYFLIGRQLRHQVDTQAYVTVVYSTSAVLLIVLALIFRKAFFGYDRTVYLLLFLIAFVPQVIGHTSFNWALKYVSASLVAVVALGEPVGASILAYFLLGEKLSSPQLFGASLIVAGVAVAIRGERRLAPQP